MKKVVDIGKIKKGGYVIYEDAAWKVLDIVHSKAGKHGHGKYRMQVASILSGKKKSIVIASGNKIDVPIIEKHNAQVLTIEESVENIAGVTINKKKVNVMDMESYETFDMNVPEEMFKEVKEGIKVMYWDVMGTKVMKQIIP